MKLSIKMILFCLLIGVLPLAGMVGYSIHTASDSLTSEAFEKMAAAAQAKKQNLEDITRSWEKDLEVYARTKGVYSALVRLRDIVFYNGKPGERMNPEDEEYAHALKRVQRDFEVFVDVLGYQDTLLMDDTGRVVYTFKRGKDLGVDLAKGPMKDTRLARAWKEALTGKVVFVDFHPYGPLDGEPNAFILGPVKRVTGEIEGVAALRLSLKEINQHMSTDGNLGETGEVFLVGPDKLMRSDYAADLDRFSVAASFRSPAGGSMDTEPVRQALQGQSGTLTTQDVDGRDVLAAYVPVRINGVSWALVAQVSTDEAFAGVHKLENAAMVLLSGSVIFIVFITLIFLRWNLFKPLNSLRRFAAAVSDGDLDAEAKGSFKAELAQVRDAIVVMVHNLRDKMHEAEEASGQARLRAEEAEAALDDAKQARQARLDADQAQRKGMLQAAKMLRYIVKHMNEASAQVNSESENIRENALSQQMRVEQTVDAIGAMSENIANVAQSATQASEAAERASRRAQSGSEVVHRTVTTIGQVNEITESLKAQVGDLGGKADDIGKIMGVISDIADQTNLLALNAAIEAARAGEAGRGFAVVADEVRKLAEKTMDATREVGQSISAIQDGVKKNIQGMEKAASAVTDANELAGESGQMLVDILEHFELTSHQITGIAAASEQQSVAGQQISEAVGEVDKVTAGTAEAVNQTGMAISILTKQIEALSKLHGLFQLLGEGAVQAEVEELAAGEDIRDMRPASLKRALDGIIREKPFLELVWVTDREGRMVTDFAQAPNAVCTLGSELCSRDWSDRDWYREPVRTGETYVSSVYYSEVVNDYCLTISVPVKDERGAVQGVFSADIRPSERPLVQ